MFLCPLCRQVANLAANVQEEEEEGEEVETGVFSLDADNMRDEVTVAVRPGEASSDSERERVDSGTGNATPIPTDAEPISTIGGQGEVEELDAMVEMVVASPRRDRDGGPAPMQQDGESDVAGPVAGTSNVVGPSTAGHAHLSSPETDGEEMEVDVKRVRDDERDEGAGGGPMEV